jgi:ABC-2 type transport system permease protein
MNFLEVFKSEAKRIFSDVALVLTIIGGVILYSFFYPQPYAKEVVSSLHVSIVDLDKSDVSRRIAFELNASPKISVIREDLSEKDAKEALLSGEIKGIIVIPENFKRDILLQTQPTIAIGADASYFLVFGSIVQGAAETILTESAKVKIASLLKDAEPLSGAVKAYTPFSLHVSTLFNSQESYVQYVVPAVFILILQQTLLIGLGILGGGINENRTKDYENSPVWMLMFSRVLIFGLIYLFHILFYFGFSFELFNITHLADPLELLSFALPFLLSTIFLGIVFGALLPSREMATPIILFSSLPLVFSAGFVWPLEALPDFIIILSLFFPSTPAIQGFLQLNQMGSPLYEVIHHYGLLYLHVILYGSLAYYLLSTENK